MAAGPSSFDADAATWTARGPRPSALMQLHRNSLTPVLIVGGSEQRRAEMAKAFHDQSPVRTGLFTTLDCASEEPILEAALRCWLSATAPGVAENPLRACARGTLFLDHLEALSLPVQRPLLALLNRFDPHNGPCARLTVGCATDPGPAMQAGTLLPALLDRLDKVRIELGDLPAPID
jgi:DNA-binding NtrC family response regulator